MALSHIKKLDSMPDGGRLPNVVVPILRGWHIGVQISEIFCFVNRFQVFVFSCPISIADMKMAENLAVSRFSAIKHPHLSVSLIQTVQIRRGHSFCLVLTKRFKLVSVAPQ